MKLATRPDATAAKAHGAFILKETREYVSELAEELQEAIELAQVADLTDDVERDKLLLTLDGIRNALDALGTPSL